MQTAIRVSLTLVVVISAGFLCYDMAQYYLYSPWTRDATVTAYTVTVAPDVSGYVTDVRVRNNQFVKTGDTLFVIDQERYRLALADAEATAEAQKAQYLLLKDQLARRVRLTPQLSIAAETLDNTRHQVDQALANHKQAIASQDIAALNLRRTEVRSAVNGYVTNLNLKNGDYATQGKAVLAVIDSDSYRVDAYFEETKIPEIETGSEAEIHLMDGSPALKGRVEGIARGITDPDNRDGPFLLSNVNPNFTWVRLAQRIPVRIHLTYVPPGVLISAGMTCTAIVKQDHQPRIGAGVKRLLAALF